MLVAEKKKHQAITDKIGHEEYPYMLYGGPSALPASYRAPYAYPTGQAVDMFVSSCSSCMHNPVRVPLPPATPPAASYAASNLLPPLSLRYASCGRNPGYDYHNHLVEPLNPVASTYHVVLPHSKPSYCGHRMGCDHNSHYFPAICQPAQVNMPWIRPVRGMI